MKSPVLGKPSVVAPPVIARGNGNQKSSKCTNYEIAMHTVRLQQSGTMISVDLTWSLQCK